MSADIQNFVTDFATGATTNLSCLDLSKQQFIVKFSTFLAKITKLNQFNQAEVVDEAVESRDQLE